MSIIRNKSLFASVICLCITSCLLAGCGKRDKTLDIYKQNMENYFSNVAIIDRGINSIDPDADYDGSQLLDYLDKLDQTTTQMAEVEVPEQFALVESLADEAADNMSSAVSLYHQLYSLDEYDPGIAEAANEYYERANKRIRYIRMILQGDIPEELVVTTDDSDSAGSVVPSDDTDANIDEPSVDESDDGMDEFDTDDTVFYEE